MSGISPTKLSLLSITAQPTKISPDANLLNRAQPDNAPDPSNTDNALGNLYATIAKDGQVIAKVYKSGIVESPNGIARTLTSGGDPLDIAKARTAEIAEGSGGTIEYARGSQTGTSAAAAKTLFLTQLLANM